jgi:hypothetical protein
MTKEIDMTEELISKFKTKFGEEVDLSNFYVFECRALSTEAVHQGTIYDGAVVATDILVSMAEKINNSDENIGIHIMHNDDDLNIGRAFSARLNVDENGSTALYAVCAILKDEESTSVVNKIENNVLDEVSVQFLSEHAYCSECHWDYMGEDATFENWWDKTCANGHTIGVDGCHLELEGLANFSEISIVNRGAAKNPKILSQKKRSLFGEGELMSLAASGKAPEFLVATFNSKLENVMKDKDNVTLSAEEISAMQAELADLKKKIDLGEKVKELETALSEKEAAIAEKEQEVSEKAAEIESANEAHEAEVKDLKEKLSTAGEENKALLSFLQEQVKKVALAAGKKDVEVPSDLGGISAMLNENQQILATLVPAGGISKAVNYADDENKFNSVQLKSYQVRR